jgi:thiamine transport system ATP-binding protein
MLDEPLGALDRALRSDLLDELAGLFWHLELPIIYVTHDREEALAVGDRVAVMRAGRLETVLPPDELWRSPPNEFVARFLGLGNVLDFRRAGGAAQTPWGDVPLQADAPERGRLLIRADALVPDPSGTLSGTVRSATFRGDHVRVLIDADTAAEPATLEAELRGAKVRAGERVTLAVTPGSVTVFAPRETDD